MTTQASGRVHHPEKVTVYLSEDERYRLEIAAVELRLRHGIRIDRGRLIREALGLALDDLDRVADRSPIVQRLREIR